MSAYSLFILFPRLLLRPLPNGCQGRFADAVLRKRCDLLREGDIQRLILDSHESQADRILSSINSASKDTPTFSKTARAAILAGDGQVGRACKVAFHLWFRNGPRGCREVLEKANAAGSSPAHSPTHFDHQALEEPHLFEGSHGCIL